MSEWKATLDKASGKTYYYNKRTRETRWDPPPGMEGAATTAAAGSGASGSSASASAGAGDGKPEWKEVIDKTSGKSYYYNRKTKKTQWNAPESFIPAKKKDADGDDAQKKKEEAEKKKAADAAAAAAASAAASASSAAATPGRTRGMSLAAAVESDDDDANWRMATDPNSGRNYYYNKVTKQTVWKDPRKNQSVPCPTRGGASSAGAASAAEPAASKAGEGEKKPAAAAEPAAAATAAASGSGSDSGGDRMAALKAEAEKEEAAMSAEQRMAALREEAKVKDREDFRKILEDEEEEEEDFAFLFAKHRKGWVHRTFRTGKILDNNEIMRFKKSLIKKALLKQNRHLDAECIQSFKNIMSYMGDRKSSKEPVGHAQKLIRNVLQAPTGLRDEVYLQLCKQTTGNPREASTLHGWELLMLALACFPPSKPLRKFLAAFFQENEEGKEHSGATQDQIKKYATHCIECLPRVLTLGQRKEVPSRAEVEAVAAMQGVSLRIYLIDDTFKTVIINSFTQAEEVREMINKKLNLTCDTPFELFEVTDGVPRAMHKSERVLDVLGKWERIDEAAKAAAAEEAKRAQKSAGGTVIVQASTPNANLPISQQNRLLFKAKLMLKTSNREVKADPEAIKLLYLQCVYDVTKGRFPVKDGHLTILAALQLQSTYGDYHADMHGNGWVQDKLPKLIPAKLLAGSSKDGTASSTVRAAWEQRIIEKYAKVKGFTSLEAKINYLDYVEQWPVYGVTYFVVNQRQFKDYPSPLLLGITCEGALLVHPDSRVTLDNYRYTDIVTWGHSDEKLILVVGNVVQQRKLVFKTKEGAVMNLLIHDYVKYKVKGQKK